MTQYVASSFRDNGVRSDRHVRYLASVPAPTSRQRSFYLTQREIPSIPSPVGVLGGPVIYPPCGALGDRHSECSAHPEPPPPHQPTPPLSSTPASDCAPSRAAPGTDERLSTDIPGTGVVGQAESRRAGRMGGRGEWEGGEGSKVMRA